MSNSYLYRVAANYPGNSFRYAWATAFAICAGLLLYRILLIFSYNGELGGIDNNFVYDVIRSIAGQPIYTHPVEPPFAITLYSPLYFTICGGTGRLLHIDVNDPIHVYQLCRTVSLVFDIITCIMLYKIARRRFGVAKELSLLAIAGFACILCLLGYTFSRCDSLLLSLYAATIYILTNRSPKNNLLHFCMLALFSVLCILAKQNGIIVPALVISWLIINDGWKKAFQYLLLFICACLLIVLYYFIYPHLFENTVQSLRNRIDLSWFYTDIFKRMMNSLWVLPLYTGGILAIKQWIKPDSREYKSIAAVFIIQALFSIGTSLKWGSTAGYFNECLLLSFILIAAKTTACQQQPLLGYAQKIVAGMLPLFILLFIHTVAEGYLFFIQHRSLKKQAYEQQKQVRDYLQPQLHDRSVFNLANANSDFFKTLLFKNIIVPNMDMVDCCTLPDRTFDYSLLKQHLQNGQTRFIITYNDNLPEQVWGIPLRGFQKDTVINGYTIYRHP